MLTVTTTTNKNNNSPQRYPSSSRNSREFKDQMVCLIIDNKTMDYFAYNVLVLHWPAHQSCLPPIEPAVQLQSLWPGARRCQTYGVSLWMGSGGRLVQSSYSAETKTYKYGQYIDHHIKYNLTSSAFNNTAKSCCVSVIGDIWIHW